MVLLEMSNSCTGVILVGKNLTKLGTSALSELMLDKTLYKIDLNPEATKISHENV